MIKSFKIFENKKSYVYENLLDKIIGLDFDGFKEILDSDYSNSINLNYKHKGGGFLHKIVERGIIFDNQDVCIKFIDLLLDKGADIDIKDNIGTTPLLDSVYLNYEKIFKHLIKRGADIKATTDKNSNILGYYANKGSNPKIIEYFLNNGIDINHENDFKQNVLNSSVYSNNLKMLKILVEKYNMDVNKLDGDGDTPIKFCSELYQIKMMKYLIKNGADLSIVNEKNGESCFDFNHKFWESKETQELLIKQNPFNISLLKKHNIPIHPDIKEEYIDLDLGSELGTI